MKLNEQGYKLICEFEGLSLKPYLCSAKVPTIGYGNTYYLNGKRVTLLDGRITRTGKSTIGELFIDGKFECYTLETSSVTLK